MDSKLEEFKSWCQTEGIQILKTKDLPYGVQLTITDGRDKVSVSLYSRGTVNIQGKSCVLKDKIYHWGNDPLPVKSEFIDSRKNRTAKFISNQNKSGICQALKQKFSRLIINENPDLDQSITYRLSLEENSEKVTLTHYNNSTLLLQGLSSQLFDGVADYLSRVCSQGFEERVARYVSDEDRNKVIQEASSVEDLAKKTVEKEWGNELLNFMYEHDRESIIAGYGLGIAIKQGNLSLPDYSPVVMPLARALEGFLLKLGIHLELTTEDNIEKDRPNVGKWLRANNQEGIKKFITNLRGHSYVLNQLNAQWTGCRHRVLHSDPNNSLILDDLDKAYGEAYQIRKAVKDAYHYFVKKRLDKESCNHNNFEESESSRSSRQTERLNFSPLERIGIDESGKGDYFGPLVIAAACVKSEDEAWLIELGVKDSKKLSDQKILELAACLEQAIPNEIVTILPQRYNELYQEIHNLNKLLAWGHARALETLLDKVEVEAAISDQFGDKSFLEKALMEKGRKITLVQKPKAEKDLAVAVASILARAELLKRLEKMKKNYGFSFSKGASPTVEEEASQFVKKFGRDRLQEVAKIHFKTTKKVLNNLKN